MQLVIAPSPGQGPPQQAWEIRKPPPAARFRGSLTSRDSAVPEACLIHGAPKPGEVARAHQWGVWSVGTLKPENREVRGHRGLEPDGEGVRQEVSIPPLTV